MGVAFDEVIRAVRMLPEISFHKQTKFAETILTGVHDRMGNPLLAAYQVPRTCAFDASG